MCGIMTAQTMMIKSVIWGLVIPNYTTRTNAYSAQATNIRNGVTITLNLTWQKWLVMVPAALQNEKFKN